MISPYYGHFLKNEIFKLQNRFIKKSFSAAP